MNREIKFRMYNKLTKEMCLVDSLDLETKTATVRSRYIGLDDDYFCQDKCFSSDDIELMQYTGFTDNSGCSFYERDICTYSDCNGDMKQGILRYNTDLMCFGFVCANMSFTPAYKTKFWVKVGTEFENPEFLEKQ